MSAQKQITRVFNRILISGLLLITGASGEALAQAFQTIAPTAILLDADTRAVLFEKNADELVAPASMAKIMTVEVLFNELKRAG